MEMPAPDQFTLSRKAEIVADCAALPVMLLLMTLQKPEHTNVMHFLHIAARPGSCSALLTEEVATALKIANEMNVPVVPRGAGTSLAVGHCRPQTV